eukprot:1186698-Prorocentrum_minimum.AAC.4
MSYSTLGVTVQRLLHVQQGLAERAPAEQYPPHRRDGGGVARAAPAGQCGRRGRGRPAGGGER